jgi:molybdate transport system permease protein
MIGSLPFGIFMAWLLARVSFPGRAIVDGIVHLPLVIPPVVTGYLLLLAFGRRGPIGQFLENTFGIVLAFNWTGAALAAAIMGFPLLVRAIRLSIEAIDPGLESAASTLGANRFLVFLSITLPLMLPGILAGAVLAFARALGEFGATIMFAGNLEGRTQTLPLAVYSEFQAGSVDRSIAAAAILVVAAAGVLVAVRSFHWGRALALRSGA